MTTKSSQNSLFVYSWLGLCAGSDGDGVSGFKESQKRRYRPLIIRVIWGMSVNNSAINDFYRKTVSFLHQAIRYRGKATYREALFLGYGSRTETILQGYIDNLAVVLSGFVDMAGAPISKSGMEAG